MFKQRFGALHKQGERSFESFLACSRLLDSEDDAQVKGTRKYEHVIWEKGSGTG